MVKMVKCSRKFITLSNLWVSSNEKFSDFFAGSWQTGDTAVPLLVLRLVLAAIAVAVLAWSVYEGANPYWLMYLTNWGLLLITMMTLSGVFISIMAVCKKYPEGAGGELPWYMSMYWFLFNVSVSVAFMITALYWILLYDPEAAAEDASGARMFWLDVATHGGNSCLALLEVLCARVPVRLAHLYQPLSIGLWYAAFTAIYFAAGGTDAYGNPFVYEVLDWRQGRRSLVVVAASAAGLIVIYTVVWGAALCRDKLSALCFRTTSVRLPNTPQDQHMPGEFV